MHTPGEMVLYVDSVSCRISRAAKQAEPRISILLAAKAASKISCASLH